MDTCKLCGQHRKLIKSHIYPASLYREAWADNSQTIYSNTEGKYPRRASIGIFDDGIVCTGCETLFGPWDDYACQFLGRSEYEGQEQGVAGDTTLIAVNNYDYSKLQLFFVSVLWRAHHCKHDFFAKINLGPHESTLRDIIRSGNPAHGSVYSVNISVFDDPEARQVMLDPQSEKIEGLNYVRMWICGYDVFMKVDRMPAPDYISRFALGPDKPLYLFKREWRGSKTRNAAAVVCRDATVPVGYDEHVEKKYCEELKKLRGKK